MELRTSRIIGSIALNQAFGYSPKASLEIIKTLGGAHELLSLSAKDLDGLFGAFSKIEGRLGAACLEEAARQYELMREQGVQFLCYEDQAYPELLRECEDAPSLLYVRSGGRAEALFGEEGGARRAVVSIVGTRDISPYGKEWCTRIVKALSQTRQKPLIVSGLAIGVDICAQMAALGYGLPTVGVSPVGVDSVYPRRHSVAAEKIVQAPGSALVSDFPFGTGAVAVNFLRRNRIIAALADATILVESKVKGGGMMTARLAASYGRTVLALPGRADDVRSGGCNQLLWEKLAEPLVSTDCMIESLGLGMPRARKRLDAQAVVCEHYSSREDKDLIVRLFAEILRHRGVGCEELMEELELSYSTVASLVGLLESDGFICTDVLRRCSVVV